MNKVLRLIRGHKPDVVALSALLDGELDAPAAERLDEHVSSCAACGEMLAGLRATREALSALPVMDAPRSFRLRQADVERAPAAASRPAPMLRWAPVAGALAAAVFVVVLAADLRSSDSGSAKLATSANRQATTAESSTGLAAGKSADTTPATGTVPQPALAPTNSGGVDSSAPLAPGPAGDPAPTPAGAQATEPYAAETADAAAAYATDRSAPPATVGNGSLAANPAPDADTDGDDGNNSLLLRVIEIIAAATALGALAVIGWRWRGVRT